MKLVHCLDNRNFWKDAITYGLKIDISKISDQKLFEAFMKTWELADKGQKYTVVINGNSYKNYYQNYSYIEAHTSPKFDKLIGKIDISSLIARRNDLDIHNGYGESFSAKWYKNLKQHKNFNADFGPIPNWSDYYCSIKFPTHHDANEAYTYAKMNRANLIAKKFNEQLEWLDE